MGGGFGLQCFCHISSSKDNNTFCFTAFLSIAMYVVYDFPQSCPMDQLFLWFLIPSLLFHSLHSSSHYSHPPFRVITYKLNHQLHKLQPTPICHTQQTKPNTKTSTWQHKKHQHNKMIIHTKLFSFSILNWVTNIIHSNVQDSMSCSISWSPCVSTRDKRQNQTKDKRLSCLFWWTNLKLFDSLCGSRCHLWDT